jgi:fructose-specific phosphotransferase system IIC component
MEGVMNMLTAMVLVTLLLTVASLVAGITSMATDGEVGHLRSEQWMGRRVGFQALALLLIVLALLI